MIFQWAF